MKTLTACPVCSSKDIEFSFKNHDRIHHVEGEFQVWRCVRCGARFINPQPSAPELKPFYGAAYYSFAAPNPANPVRKLERWWIRHVLTRTNPFSWALSLANPLLREAKIIKQRVYPFAKGGALLDIGAGSGEFVAQMNAAGMTAVGVDPYADPARVLPGVTVFATTLNQAPLQPKSFDIITFNHVLEHAPDPHDVLQQVHRLLKDDGRVVFAVPNIESPTARKYGAHWMHWDTPRHLVMYNIHALKLLTHKHGFRMVRVRDVCDRRTALDARASQLAENGASPAAVARARSRFLGLFRWPAYALRCWNDCGEHLELTLAKVNA
jgi:2-polyprenyl-3-methyl-5-hydroxy-6-metoxy-1,4-benzoquinol methylase